MTNSEKQRQYGLTPRQKEVLDYIKQYSLDTGGCSPTIREIALHFHRPSTSSTYGIVQQLVKKGHIAMLPHSQCSITVLD